MGTNNLSPARLTRHLDHHRQQIERVAVWTTGDQKITVYLDQDGERTVEVDQFETEDRPGNTISDLTAYANQIQIAAAWTSEHFEQRWAKSEPKAPFDVSSIVALSVPDSERETLHYVQSITMNLTDDGYDSLIYELDDYGFAFGEVRLGSKVVTVSAGHVRDRLDDNLFYGDSDVRVTIEGMDRQRDAYEALIRLCELASHRWGGTTKVQLRNARNEPIPFSEMHVTGSNTQMAIRFYDLLGEQVERLSVEDLVRGAAEITELENRWPAQIHVNFSR